jgi:hypothetical protein
MDKKKINTVLIIALTCIWSVVLYKFINPLFVKTNIAQVIEIPNESILTPINKKDTVILNFPERDPFLGKIKNTNIVKPKPRIKTVKSISKVTAQIVWPKIQFLGYVKSNSSKNKLGLVRVDGKLYRVNRNSTVAGLTIKDVTDETVIIANGKDEKIFKRQ